MFVPAIQVRGGGACSPHVCACVGWRRLRCWSAGAREPGNVVCWCAQARASAARLARSPRRVVVPAMTARVMVSPLVPLKQFSCCELQHAEHQERVQRQSVLRERSGDQHIRLDSLAVSATHMSQKGAAGEALNGRRSVYRHPPAANPADHEMQRKSRSA
jgi:hypothetical protein